MDHLRACLDSQANAAYVYFGEIARGEVAKSLPAADEVAAVPDFAADGQPLGAELLDVERQLPRVFRD
ncbi:DUF2283 domain-containing protein [Actinopolyspora halophila]|uniref:DUF2283 domain-containing protein n=1 Tax=Actinopolyspora halophila TaxID=1850 RepID=UPI000370244C|nr:DUF2283 domain-containing protein [Actinopolyspora halophila]